VDLDISADDRAFREEVRTWLHENVPAGERPDTPHGIRTFDLAWQRRQYEGGWAGIAWPGEYGGRGLSLIEQLIWHEEYALAGAPDVGSNFVGLNHGGPTLIARATDDQKRFHLPKILRGEAVWCQGFSEPNAGSDLAALQTRADIDGDELVVTGQKIWTSYAEVADYQELLVRTDRDAPKHKGITWVICDMSLPGIDIRPIKTMHREFHFAEVFYDDVRIPLKNVVGRVNDGWSVAMSTLGFERGTALMSRQVALAQQVEALLELARDRTTAGGRPLITDEEVAGRLAAARAQVAALRAMVIAIVSRNARVEVPGPYGSMVKMYFATVAQAVAKLAMDLVGNDAFRFVPQETNAGWTGNYMKTFSVTIGGGTSEIQRNIIGERVLGLPR
jgi:alkylation response protein AidB-like acyl-CoA dehydrogenase